MTTIYELSGSNYSETDSSNDNAAPAGMPEGMAPSGVNDAWRAGMGALKRFWDRIQGAFASTGSANAYVLTPTVALVAYVTGERYSFRSNFANTGACTLNISALGAKSIKVMGTGGKADPASGDIQSGQPVTVEYDGTDLVMVTPSASAMTGFVVSNLSTKTTPTTSDSVVIMDAADSSKAKTATIAEIKTTLALPFTEKFVSSELTLPAAGNATANQAHSLAAAPVMIGAYIVCKTAEGGYSVGDRVAISSLLDNAYNGTSNVAGGFSIHADATNLALTVASGSVAWQIVHKSTGAIFQITTANWKLVLWCF